MTQFCGRFAQQIQLVIFFRFCFTWHCFYSELLFSAEKKHFLFHVSNVEERFDGDKTSVAFEHQTK